MQTAKANPEPNCLAFDEKINISVTIARKRARAKEHDNPDNEKSQHSEKKNIGALTMHGYVERAFCFAWRTSFFFSLAFTAFPSVFFGFVVLGINSFWPIRNLRGSSIWLSSIKSSYGTLSFFAIVTGLSPFFTTYVFPSDTGLPAVAS